MMDARNTSKMPNSRRMDGGEQQPTLTNLLLERCDKRTSTI